jgi:hypothetical protein
MAIAMGTKTKKTQILNYLTEKWGSGTFRYTDITIAALMVNGLIQDPSEYNWKEHRGYYACAITGYSGDYMFKSSKRESRGLRTVREASGKKRYRIVTYIRVYE